jgi:hypothetical protein
MLFLTTSQLRWDVFIRLSCLLDKQDLEYIFRHTPLVVRGVVSFVVISVVSFVVVSVVSFGVVSEKRLQINFTLSTLLKLPRTLTPNMT